MSNSAIRDASEDFRGAVQHVFDNFIMAPKPSLPNDIGIAMLGKRNVIEIFGPPGIGKSQLVEALCWVMTGERAVIINCNGTTRSEDYVFQTIVKNMTIEGGTEFAFDVSPKPFMEKSVVFLDEANRINQEAQHDLLGIMAEGALTCKGKRLYKKDGLIFLAYNPYYGEFDQAMNDRINVSIAMGTLDFLGQHDLMKRFFLNRSNPPRAWDVLTPKLDAARLDEIWELVNSVQILPEDIGRAGMYLASFSACKHGNLGEMSKDYLDSVVNCDSCEFKTSCLTSNLTRPILTRGMVSFMATAKSSAFWHGRSEVIPQEDYPIALRLTMAHRANLKASVKAQTPNTHTWFEKVVTETIKNAEKGAWAAAFGTYKGIRTAIKDGKPVEAGLAKKEFMEQHKDIVAHQFLETFTSRSLRVAEKKALADAEATILAAYNGNGVMKYEDVDQVAETVSWIPVERKTNFKKAYDDLMHHRDSQLILSKADAMLLMTRMGGNLSRATILDDGSRINAVVVDNLPNYERYQVNYELVTTKHLGIFRKFSEKAAI